MMGKLHQCKRYISGTCFKRLPSVSVHQPLHVISKQLQHLQWYHTKHNAFLWWNETWCHHLESNWKPAVMQTRLPNSPCLKKFKSQASNGESDDDCSLTPTFPSSGLQIILWHNQCKLLLFCDSKLCTKLKNNHSQLSNSITLLYDGACAQVANKVKDWPNAT